MKVTQIVFVTIMFILFGSNSAKAEDNTRILYKELYYDALIYNNALAILELERLLSINQTSTNSSLGITVVEFEKIKAQVCINYFSGSDASTLSSAEKSILESACNTPLNLI